MQKKKKREKKYLAFTMQVNNSNDTGCNYSRQQNYSSTCENTCEFSLFCLPDFIISCLL